MQLVVNKQEVLCFMIWNRVKARGCLTPGLISGINNQGYQVQILGLFLCPCSTFISRQPHKKKNLFSKTDKCGEQVLKVCGTQC